MAPLTRFRSLCPQVAMATGQVLFHRFFYSKSFVKHSFEVSGGAGAALGHAGAFGGTLGAPGPALHSTPAPRWGAPSSDQKLP